MRLCRMSRFVACRPMNGAVAFLIWGGLAGFLAGCDPAPPPPRPAEQYPQLSSDGAWCWFGDPRGVRYQGDHDRIYTGWVDSEGSIVVGSLDLESGEQVQRTLHPAFNIVVFYTSHGADVSEAMYYRVSERPEDVTAWGERLEIGSNTDGPRGHTYPNPVQLSEEAGRIYLFWRGGNFKPSFSYTDDLVTWSPAQTLIRSDEATAVRPYVKVASNNRDEIHLAFTDGHPRDEPQNSIYYLKYAGGEFTRADGSLVGTMSDLPLAHDSSDLVYDGRTTGVRAWIWDVAADEDGRPIIVYARLPAEADHRYHYARWTGEEWIDSEIVASGGWFPNTPEGVVEPEPHYSGGVVLDHGDPSVVYLSRPVGRVFEIERWRTRDGGDTWRTHAVTAGSARDNVRPFVIRNHGRSSPTLLWMENRRYRHYLDFDASIRMDRGAR